MNDRRILILADAGRNAGSGHMMRCTAVMKELAELGFETSLKLMEIADGGSGSSGSALKASDNEDCSLILLDSYHTSAEEMEELRKKAVLVCMDDTLPFRYPADMVINYNIYAEELPYQKVYDKGEKLLLGSRYLPLREQFRNLPQRSTQDDFTAVKKVFLSTGGSDPYHTAELMLKILPAAAAAHDLEFALATGPFNPHIDEICGIADRLDNVTVMKNIQDMAGLMRQCQLAVSASGTTLWELCAAGTPAVSYVLADNQIMNAETFDRKGLCLYAGDVRDKDVFAGNLERVFESCLSKSRDELLGWSQRMQQEADGLGAARIAREIACMI